MKKSILFAMFLGSVFAANAQTTPGSLTTAATLNVRLYPIQTITINNTSGNEVNLDYKTADDYDEGVEVNQVDHLKIYSTGAFAVDVNSTTSTLTSTTLGSDPIDVEDITITATEGTNPLVNADYSPGPVALGQAPVRLFSSKTGGNGSTVNVKYSTVGNHAPDAYLNKHVNGQNATVYKTEVVYTIAAQ